MAQLFQHHLRQHKFLHPIVQRINSEGLWQLLKKKIIGTPIDFNQSSFEFEILSPQQHQFAPPAIFIYHHLSRITGTGPYSTLGSELSLLFTQHITHVPTLLYKINNVTINRGGLWRNNRQYWNRKVDKNSTLAPINMQAATIIDQNYTSVFFGHWLMDFVPATLTANPHRPALALNKPQYFHNDSYEKLFGLDVTYANSGFIKELYFLSDLTQNAYKLSRYLALKDRLKKQLNPDDCQYAGVYIVRGTSGVKRILKNEQALIHFLANKGFDIIDPVHMQAEDIVRRLWNAPMVISVEGSGATHAICTAAKCAGYLFLMPPNRFLIILKGILDALNNPFGFYVCKPAMLEPDSFYVDSMPDIERLIDLVKQESANRLSKSVH